LKIKQSKELKPLNFKDSALVSSFLGLPNHLAERRSRPPASMEKIIDRVWENWKFDAEQSPERTISENWQKVVGMKLAGKCAPINLSKDGKTLVIKAASSTIKQEILFISGQILKKINCLKKCRDIKNLKIY
jgi:hypothetical protein